MDYSTLPSYPPRPACTDRPQPQSEQLLTPRQTQIFIDLAWLAVIVVLLLWTRQLATDIERDRQAGRSRVSGPPQPLDFRRVAEMFGQVQKGTSRAQVEMLLGPPAERHEWGPEVDQFGPEWWNGGKSIYPKRREWHRWSDPTDPERWVVVMYFRWSEQEVIGMFKKGF